MKNSAMNRDHTQHNDSGKSNAALSTDFIIASALGFISTKKYKETTDDNCDSTGAPKPVEFFAIVWNRCSFFHPNVRHQSVHKPPRSELRLNRQGLDQRPVMVINSTKAMLYTAAKCSK